MANLDFTNFAIKQKFTEGQAVLFSDLENATTVAQSNLLHLLSSLIATDSGVLGSCVIGGLVPTLSGSDVNVTAGVGLSYDAAANTDDFDYETAHFVVVPTAFDSAIPAEPGSYPRVDVLYLIPATVEDTTDSRVVVDTSGPTFTPTNIDLRKMASYTDEWETGTAGSYTVPAIPAGGIALANVIRVSSGVSLVYDRRLPASIDNRNLPYPGTSITKPFVVSGCVSTHLGGLLVTVTSGVACVGSARRRVVTPTTVVTVGSDAGAARWTYITAETDGSILATVGTATYAAPAADDCRLASVYVVAAGTTPGDIIDERNLLGWARGDHFARGERVPVANLPGVHWYLESANITSDGNDGFYFEGSLQWPDGTSYNPSVDGELTLRADLWLRQDAATESDGAGNYTAYHWTPCVQSLPLGVAQARSYFVPGIALIPHQTGAVYPSVLASKLGVAGSAAVLQLSHTITVPKPGSTLNTVTVYYDRTTTLQGDITATLYEVNPTSGGHTSLATISSLAAAATSGSLVLTPAAEMDPARAYHLTVSLVGGASGGDTVFVKSVYVAYSTPTQPAYTAALGVDPGNIVSAYQGGQAVWSNNENSTKFCVHARSTNRDLSEYDRLRLVLTVDRVATNVDDGSGLTPAEAAARAATGRTSIIVTPPSITTTTQVEVAL